MTVLRMLLPGAAVVGVVDHGRDRADDAVQAVADLYAYPDPLPEGGWVRANMVSSLDGSATGADGLSGSVSGGADRVVFRVLRGLADVVLVGAGTARAEGYRAPSVRAEFTERRDAAGQQPAPALAIVTRTGRLPEDGGLLGGSAPVYALTCAAADTRRLRATLGEAQVLVAGEDRVDPALAVTRLAALGLRRILLEGGPTLLGAAAGAGCVDELCLTVSPLLLGGDGPRIAHGAPSGLRLRSAHLLEADGYLLGRWLVQR
jgi:riboflavin biosynthesis pyrimidine reductase